MGEIKVAAVVVTYNRKKLLMECLNAILRQSYPVSDIVIIDNASTDGTEVELKINGFFDDSRIHYFLLENNIGGAGGFYEGIRKVGTYSADWIWIMDDDTIPMEDCLIELLNGNKLISNDLKNQRKISFLASAIYGLHNEYMNLPMISHKLADNGYEYWYQFLKDGMVNISSATFVSILINMKAIKKCGYPCKEYFIWGDDWEYTRRLTKYYGDAYMVGDRKSVV